MHTPHPTAYPEVNALLQELLARARAVLGECFVGLYVHGSVASGDFEPQRSDIDFLVVTVDELPAKMLPALQAMHARIHASGMKWATKLEGSYIPRQALRRYDPAHALHPALRVDGTFDVDAHGADWVIQRHVIREQGIAVAGPDPRTLIDPVPPDDLRRAAAGTLREWWAPQLQDHSRLRQPQYRAYAVLTMCRVLYTVQHGTVVPKGVAAQWAQRTLGEPWAALISRALAWPLDGQEDTLDDTLRFLRYTLERSGEQAPAADEA
jgi:hypothetical protein